MLLNFWVCLPLWTMVIYSSFLCVSALLSIATAVEPVDVKVTHDKSTGDFQISLQGQEWLRSGAVSVVVEKQQQGQVYTY